MSTGMTRTRNHNARRRAMRGTTSTIVNANVKLVRRGSHTRRRHTNRRLVPRTLRAKRRTNHGKDIRRTRLPKRRGHSRDTHRRGTSNYTRTNVLLVPRRRPTNRGSRHHANTRKNDVLTRRRQSQTRIRSTTTTRNPKSNVQRQRAQHVPRKSNNVQLKVPRRLFQPKRHHSSMTRHHQIRQMTTMTTRSLLTSRSANRSHHSRSMPIRHNERRRHSRRHRTLAKGVIKLMSTPARRQSRAITRVTNSRHHTTRRRQPRPMRVTKRTRRQSNRPTSVPMMTTHPNRFPLLHPSRYFVRNSTPLATRPSNTRPPLNLPRREQRYPPPRYPRQPPHETRP